MRAALAAVAGLAIIASPAAALDVFAHRGGPLVEGWAAFPENTLPAFRHAARAGTALEFDVRLTRDRVPLVIHDATFDRTTTCRGAVTAYRFASVQQRCRATWPGRPRRTTAVPTLTAVLAVAERNWVPVMVEIKGVGDARAVTDTLRRSRLPRRFVIVQSFDPRALRVAQHRWPGVPTALLSTNGGRRTALRQAVGRFTYVAPRWPVSRDYVTFAHAVGVRVLPFGVRSAGGFARAVRVGADAFITDDPAAAFRAILFAVALGQHN